MELPFLNDIRTNKETRKRERDFIPDTVLDADPEMGSTTEIGLHDLLAKVAAGEIPEVRMVAEHYDEDSGRVFLEFEVNEKIIFDETAFTHPAFTRELLIALHGGNDVAITTAERGKGKVTATYIVPE